MIRDMVVTNGAAHLAAEDIVKARGDRIVLNGVTVTVSAGDRLGLIGENGVGKSTLLRILAGSEAPDRGQVRSALEGRPRPSAAGTRTAGWLGPVPVSLPGPRRPGPDQRADA